jgi:hypothetical protein
LRPRLDGAERTRLPTWALQQVGTYLEHAVHQIDVVVTAARDPTPPRDRFPRAAARCNDSNRVADAKSRESFGGVNGNQNQ